VCLGRGQKYEVNGYYPIRLFWDVNDARLLVCEAILDSEYFLQQQATAADSNKVFVIVVIVDAITTVFYCYYSCS